jgi:LPS sulfotransferase NodH
MEADICLLLAAERSGTHLLRSLLANARGVVAPGEICNATVPQNRNAPTSFFRFRKQSCLEDPELFFPTEPVQRRLLDSFVDSLRSSYPGNALVVLDVKYAHVHNFNFFWWDPLEIPYLLQYAKRKPLKILHLVRNKVYRTAISGFYAHKTGVWRAKSEDQTKQIRISIDPSRLQSKAVLLARTIARFNSWLSRCPHLQISYEALTEDRSATLQLLQRYLELEHEISDSPGFVKTTPPLEEFVENYPEIVPLVDVDWTEIAKSSRKRRVVRPRLDPANGPHS